MIISYLYNFNLRKKKKYWASNPLSMWAGLYGDNIRNVASLFSFQELCPEPWDSDFHLTHGKVPWRLFSVFGFTLRNYLESAFSQF